MRIYESRIAGDEYEVCFLCGRRACHTHHIFGGPCRNASDRHKLTVRLCLECHMQVHKVGPEMAYLHELGQRTYEEQIGTREQFREEFIRSYL